MRDITYHPENAEDFDKMIEGAKTLFDRCEGLRDAAVVYGSVAYAFYTEDASINVGDLDFIVPEKWFPVIGDSVRDDADFTVSPGDHSLRVFWNKMKLSFHGAEHHTPEALENVVAGVMNSVLFSFIEKELLLRLYNESALTGQEEKKAEYIKKSMRIRNIVNHSDVPRLIIVNGPGAVGKTTLTNRLCELLPQPCVRINIDELRHLVTSRKQFPEISYPLARKFARGVLEEALADGRDVVIDKMLYDEPSYGDIGSAVDVYRMVAAKYNAHVYEFALMASVDTLMKRAEERGFRADGSVTPETVIEFHDAMEGFVADRDSVTVIDTDSLNAEAVLEKVLNIISISQ